MVNQMNHKLCQTKQIIPKNSVTIAVDPLRVMLFFVARACILCNPQTLVRPYVITSPLYQPLPSAFKLFWRQPFQNHRPTRP